MELKYRTRGNSSPQGKARVLFACHPGDHDTYFENISGQILSHQNCAIWFFDPEELQNSTSESAIEDVLQRLSEMQLFVFPVTTKLLVNKSFARDSLIGFAKQNHIPILPVMMEKGLEDIYTARFGDIQFLDIRNSDPTAVPFDKRLETYLSKVLVGDELAERVRAAFDAYVFLSYRKKDRRYAQKLMRMIHGKPQYRDVAIWYDEYLVPGEDFNDAIRAALEKSEAFALVVTPSLLEDPNYVMEHEYPEARKSGKEIMAFEMSKTDRELLERFYKEIPECITDADVEQRETLFIEFLHREAFRESENDPVHNFLIGLAYLDGIDVEVDHEKAVALITGAAESGETEAIEKLVGMYHEGKGVVRSYRTSMYWQEKLLEALRLKWNGDRSRESNRELSTALWECGNEYLAMRKADIAAERYAEQLELAKEAGNDIGLIISYGNLGDAAWVLEQPEEAKAYYKKSLEIAEVMAEENETVNARRLLSGSYGKLGDIESKLGHPEAAKTYYCKSLEIDIALADETETAVSLRDLSISYESLGDAERELGHPETAKTYYEKSLETNIALAEETETIDSRYDLSTSYSNLGDAECDLGHVEAARAYYEKAHEVAEALAEETGTIGMRRNLAASYDVLGNLEDSSGHYEEAKTYYEKALEIAETISKESETADAHRSLSVSYSRLGDATYKLGDLEAARAYYEKAHEIGEALAEETGTIEFRRNLSAIYANLGDTEREMGHHETAKTYHEKSLEIVKAIAEESKTIQSRRDLAAIYSRLGNTEYVLGNIKAAKDYHENSLEIVKAIAEESGTAETDKWISIINGCLEEDAMGLFRNCEYRDAAQIHIEIMDMDDVLMRNDLAFLIRFGHLSEDELTAPFSLKIPELLSDGVREKEGFSLVNMALYCIENKENEDACRYFAMVNPEDWADLFDFWYQDIWLEKDNDPEGALISLLANRAAGGGLIAHEECKTMKDTAKDRYADMLRTDAFNDLLSALDRNNV